MAGQPKIQKSEEEWRAALTPEQYRILRHQGTEPPFSHPFNDEKREGVYVCAGCGSPLFASADKYESGSGWPSFTRPAQAAALAEHDDRSMLMRRTEIRCAACDGHLGHVFPDGPAPTGLRYCINGAALKLKTEDGALEDDGLSDGAPAA